jgi:hypothetical protein
MLGSMAPMERSETSSRPADFPWVALLGLLAAAGASVLIRGGRRAPAGFLRGGGGRASPVAALGAPRQRVRFSEAVAERIGDAAILGAVAWISVDQDPWTTAAALTAMATAYLAAYVRAKATGLGFTVEEPIGELSFRFALLGVGVALGGGVLLGALWLAVFVSAQALVRVAGRIGRQAES